MECVPDLAFLQMAAVSNNEMFNKMMWGPAAAAAAAAASGSSNGGGGSSVSSPVTNSPSGGTMKQRKTNFTSREVEALLQAVAERKETVLFGVAGGLGWARAWHEVAQQVSAVEGIHRSESDVRKKWTYLKWEAKNTSKPGRDPTSRAVLEILTSRDRESASAQGSNSLLEQLLVPATQGATGGRGSPGPGPSSGGGSSPGVVPIAPKKSSAPSPQVTAPVPPPEVCLRWNSYHSNMQATFPSLLNNEQFVDVTLACEGRSIKCHKMMLSACSTYFEELLSQNPCQHPIVFMKDLKFWEVQALVEFMYTGEVNVAQDKLPSLLAAAQSLQIKGLTNSPSGAASVAGGGGGGGNASNQDDEDSVNSMPEHDDSPLPLATQKRIRKRKASHPTAYLPRTPPGLLAHSTGHLLHQSPPQPAPAHQPQISSTGQLRPIRLTTTTTTSSPTTSSSSHHALKSTSSSSSSRHGSPGPLSKAPKTDYSSAHHHHHHPPQDFPVPLNMVSVKSEGSSQEVKSEPEDHGGGDALSETSDTGQAADSSSMAVSDSHSQQDDGSVDMHSKGDDDRSSNDEDDDDLSGSETSERSDRLHISHQPAIDPGDSTDP